MLGEENFLETDQRQAYMKDFQAGNLRVMLCTSAGAEGITLTAAQQLNLNLVTMLMIPGVILGSGVYTWWRRR